MKLRLWRTPTFSGRYCLIFNRHNGVCVGSNSWVKSEFQFHTDLEICPDSICAVRTYYASAPVSRLQASLLGTIRTETLSTIGGIFGNVYLTLSSLEIGYSLVTLCEHGLNAHMWLIGHLLLCEHKYWAGNTLRLYATARRLLCENKRCASTCNYPMLQCAFCSSRDCP